MSILHELTTAIESYPHTNVELEIIDHYVPGGAINVNETSQFRVRIHNRGPLTMRNVQLKCVAKNGSMVSSQTAPVPVTTEVSLSPIYRIQGHGEATSDLLFLKAPQQTKRNATDLCTVIVDEWDGDLDHMLNAHTRAFVEPNATVRSRVLPS